MDAQSMHRKVARRRVAHGVVDCAVTCKDGLPLEGCRNDEDFEVRLATGRNAVLVRFIVNLEMRRAKCGGELCNEAFLDWAQRLGRHPAHSLRHRSNPKQPPPQSREHADDGKASMN